MKTLRPYQEEAVEFALQHSTINGDDFGLGKTLIGVEVCRRRLSPRLIICKHKAIPQWVDEILGQDPGADVLVYTGPRDAARLFKVGYVICHYQGLKYLPENFVKFSTIILDEAHWIKNRKAQRTKDVKRYAGDLKLALSATLAEKSVADIWSVLNWLYPRAFNSYWRFCNEWVQYDEIPTPYGTAHVASGCKDPEGLSELLAPITIRRLKEQVLPQLPPNIQYNIRVEMEPVQRTLYNTVAASKDIEVDNLVIQNELVRLVRLHQLSTDPQLLEYAVPSGKLLWLHEWLEEHPDEPTVIFSQFAPTAQRIAEAIGCAYFDSKSKSRPESDFKRGASKRLVGTIAGMGESIDLPTAATAIFVDQHWSATLMEQALNRIHRMNITTAKSTILLWSTAEDADVIDCFTSKWSENDLVYKFLERRHSYD